MPHAPPTTTKFSAGTERRMFIVLCHFDHGASRRMLRHVPASSTEDIIDSLHAEFKRPCTGIVRYYSTNAASYVPLLPRDWDRLPKCLELQVEFATPLDETRHDESQDAKRGEDERGWWQPGPGVGGKPKQVDHRTQFTTAADASRSSSATFSGVAGGKSAGNNNTATSSLAGDDEPGTGTEATSFKAKLVKYVRSQLLPLFNDHQITREEVIVTCSAVAYDYAATLADSIDDVDAAMNAVSRAPLTSDVKNQLLMMLEKYVVGGVLPVATEHSSERGPSQTTATTQRVQKENIHKAKKVLLQANAPEGERHKKKKQFETNDSALKGFYEASPQQSSSPLGKNGGHGLHDELASSGQGTPVSRGPGGGGGFTTSGTRRTGEAERKFRSNDGQEYYAAAGASHAAHRRPDAQSTLLRGWSQQQQQRPSTAPGSTLTPEAIDAAANASIFKAVHYTVAGRFPTTPPASSTDASSSLEVSLTSPNMTSSEHDVVIIGRIHSKVPVTLTWWLAYGIHRHVLDMDALYLNRCVSTYQVSPNGFILTIRSGALVEGWDYFVHLTVNADLLGKTAYAQASFHLPSAFRRVSELEKFARQQTSGMNAFTAGYYGDEEFGALSPEPLRGGGGAAPSSSTPPPQADGGGPTTPGGTPAPAAANWRTRTTPPPQHATRTFLGMTYQEQLRAFFLEQIEPLYFICETPNLPHMEFKTIVKDVARKFWFARPADATVDDVLRKEIVLLVKQALVKRRVEADAALTSATDVPTVNMRPQYATVLRR